MLTKKTRLVAHQQRKGIISLNYVKVMMIPSSSTGEPLIAGCLYVSLYINSNFNPDAFKLDLACRNRARSSR